MKINLFDLVNKNALLIKFTKTRSDCTRLFSVEFKKYFLIRLL